MDHTILCRVVSLLYLFPSRGQEAQPQQQKKVWTKDDLKRFPSYPTTDVVSAERLADQKTNEPYRREKDPQGYVRQLEPLRRDLATVEPNLRGLSNARKYGKDATSAVNLDQEAEGVTTEDQMTVYQTRRDQLLKRIDELEEQARHNDILPGEVRERAGADERASGNTADMAGNVSGEKIEKHSRAVRELEDAVTAGKKHLADANKEVDLVRRDQRLEEQRESSNPEPRSRRDSRTKRAEVSSDLARRQIEVQDLFTG